MHRTGHLKVIPGDKPGLYTVTLDGEDVSHLVSGLTVEYGPGSLPRAELDVIAVETECEGEPDLYLKAGTADLLRRLGWTPPGEAKHSRAFTPADVETAAEALWVYWHRDTRWETAGWSAQPAYEQQAYRDKARYALRSLGTLTTDDALVTAMLGEPDSTQRPTGGE